MHADLGPPAAEPITGPVAVIGAGTMGAGIAQVALEAGHEVRLQDVSPEALLRALERIREGLFRRAARRVPEEGERGGWVVEHLARIRTFDTAADVEAAVTDAALVVEAALEDRALKRDLFTRLDRAAPPRTPIASNTSALKIHDLAMATYRPERVLGLHFFNPAPLMALVEVVSHPTTDRELAAASAATVAAWGKTPVACRDSPGFIVNRVNRPYTLEALRLLRAGAGTVESIDAALTDAGYPLGPFALMDLVGLDVNLATARNLFEAFDRAPRFRPSPIQESLVEAGHLGRKSGEGFYRHDASGRPIGVAPRFSGSPGPGSLDAGSIAERVILAVVNEAYRALGDRVATAADIDLALRLGANHPFGPFEWASETGLAEVAVMLDALTPEDVDTFRPAIALLRAAAG
ncbi:MAG: 3-hydroxyacyl-CoA dehydrogenase NAD-binding domain-containing protein [Chloroflexi bacterium]|nr:3-hydroxyacyl-CoA dehydrogenase NAD-binding domain-containing protein [Chloroflexota bacterium]